MPRIWRGPLMRSRYTFAHVDECTFRYLMLHHLAAVLFLINPDLLKLAETC